jgi:uncharacterized membrane protein
MKNKSMTLASITLIVTATTTALIAGLFFAWSCSISAGLSVLTDSEYIAAMQAINRAILNPLFFSCFMGTAILLPISTYQHYSFSPPIEFWLLLFASLIYMVGVMGVTIFGNVPMNEVLDAFNIQTASLQEISAQRAKFEIPWTRLNFIRTISSTASIVLVIIACLKK